MAAAKKPAKRGPVRPKKVTICGHNYRIKYCKVLPDGSSDAGMIVPSELTIYINTEMGGEGDTILHEIIHGILAESGVWTVFRSEKNDAKAEENLVGIMTPHLRESLKSLGWKEPKALSLPKDKP